MWTRDALSQSVCLRRRALLKTLGITGLAAAMPTNASRLGADADVSVSALDPNLLSEVARRAARLDQLNALIVARGGEIALGEVFHGPPLERVVNVKSISKTIVASLVGAALDREVLNGVDQELSELLPDRIPPDADPKVGDITLAHLLTMQAGLERTSGPNYGRWVESDDWIAFALSRPFVDEPGGRMLYSTGSYHVLGAALSEASGESLLALARAWIGAPLGIAIPPWSRDPQGFYLGGNNMALSPLALFRFGEVWRRGGLWEGTRVLSEAWIEASWTPRTHSPFSGDGYGYGWFLSHARGWNVAYARGYGGQMLYLVPTLGLTIVVTSDTTRPARSGGYFQDLAELVSESIIPAAEQA